MSNPAARIAENVAEVRGRIAEAAARAGRAAGEIRLVAVTKYVSPQTVRPLVAAGCFDLGESRPQQLWQKAEALADLPIRWHLIGHFQRNKVRRTLPLVSMVHSVDSPRLLAAIDEEWKTWEAERKSGRLVGGPGPVSPASPTAVLLEVNISGEPAKHGFAPESIGPFFDELAEPAGDRHIAVCGLMCMAGLEGGAETARRDFAALRRLRDRLRPNCPSGVTLDELSMGMSGDYEIAIHEGATIVRVGSALLEGIEPLIPNP
jgi:pyridoxal phosphate enzyme (YggS family)